jgi:peptide/nickel transport system substrate-binding protein
VSSIRPKLRRRLAVPAILVSASLALAGCAAGGGETPAPADSELRIGIPAYPGSWDQDFVAFDPVALALFKNVYPYMVDYGVTEVDGGTILDTENIMPSWAESFTSEDGQLWTLTLRDGVTFPSGNPMTADDVKWSKDRAFAAQANVVGVYSLIGLTSPDQIEVVDERTVTFQQDYPSALTPQIQAISLFVYDSVLMKEHATDEDPWAQDWAAQNPSDGGLFNASEFTAGQEIVLEANEDYPGDEGPAVDTIRLTVVSDPSAQSILLQNGDIDIALGLGRQQIADLDGVAGVKVISAPSNEILSIPLNTTMAPFDNVLVRQAVAYAIPYDDIISTVYGGDARRPLSVVPIDMPGYTEDAFPYDQDLEKAKELLDQAGVSGLSVELAYAAGNESQEQIAIVVQDALSKVGVTVTPTPLDPATLGERRTAKDLPMQITSGQAWVNDVEYLMAGWTTGAFLNYANYSNPVVDANVTASHTITDQAERLALWSEIQEQFAADVPVIPLAQPNYNLPVRDNVQGFVQPVDGLLRMKFLSLG